MEMMSAQINELAKALAHAQEELEPAAKNASNPMLRNRYADLGACVEAVNKVLPRHGLSVSQLCIPAEDPAYIKVRTLLMHDSGQWLASDCQLRTGGNKGVNEAQAAGSAITYARRYGLSAIVGLTADDDDGCAAGPTRKEAIQRDRAEARASNPDSPSKAAIAKMFAVLKEAGLIEREAVLEKVVKIVGHPISTSNALTADEVGRVIATVTAEMNGGANG